MEITKTIGRIRNVFVPVVACLCILSQGFTQPFVEEITAFKKADSVLMPPKGAVLFTGSSSIRLWHSLAADFPLHNVINRGFGGAALPDVARYLPEIVFPYNAATIVLYCGENDFAESPAVTPDTVFRRFVSLYFAIRVRYPATRIVYISMKPSPARRHLIPSFAEANDCIKAFLRKQPHTAFADVYHPMLDRAGNPDGRLFGPDSLHMSAQGYQIWQRVIRKFL